MSKRIVQSLSLCAVIMGIAHAETISFSEGDRSFEIEFVTIDHPGNEPDEPDYVGNTWGDVDYVYQIAKYELPNAASIIWQGHKPLSPDNQVRATKMDWHDAAKFVNWLNEKEGYDPAYRFDRHEGHVDWYPTQPEYDPENRFRNSRARYVIPTGDEWYKAAYYDPEGKRYFDYATGSDELPTGSNDPTTNQNEIIWGNFRDFVDVTKAGGLSPFGTMGQTGNANEWEEGFWHHRQHGFRSGGQGTVEGHNAHRSWIRPWTNANPRVVRLMPNPDSDGDGVLAGNDIDLLTDFISTKNFKVAFDLNEDMVVDERDRAFFVEEIVGTVFGDANLDGFVDFEDFLALSASFDQGNGWAGGNFDGDGRTDFDDFLILSENFGATREISSVHVVPEPTGLWFAILLTLFGFRPHVVRFA